MSGPNVVVTLPSGSIFTSYYTQIDALTDAQGDPTNAVTPDEGTVTVSGTTHSRVANSTGAALALTDALQARIPDQARAGTGRSKRMRRAQS